MRTNGYDPFRFERPRPEPVDGPLPPPVALVEDDDLPRSPRWRYWLGLTLIALFVVDLTARLISLIARPTGGDSAPEDLLSSVP